MTLYSVITQELSTREGQPRREIIWPGLNTSDLWASGLWHIKKKKKSKEPSPLPRNPVLRPDQAHLLLPGLFLDPPVNFSIMPWSDITASTTDSLITLIWRKLFIFWLFFFPESTTTYILLTMHHVPGSVLVLFIWVTSFHICWCIWYPKD